MELVISTKIYDDSNLSEYVDLLKDDVGEFYLSRTIQGWKRISDIEKTWNTLLKHNYYVNKTVVPLVYYILSTDPQQLDLVFEFLYRENFIEYEEEEDS